MNYYPKCPNPELTAGVARHSDTSTITVLLQDNVGGLYDRSLDDDDKWIHVVPIQGALAINAGDMLQIMSNDKHKSIEHCMVANRRQNRVSVAAFLNPTSDVRVTPYSEALESGEKAVYKEILSSDYEEHCFSKEHDGKKTLDFVRIEPSAFVPSQK